MRAELSCLQEMDHPHIIKFYEAYVCDKGKEVHMVMEMCEGGELFDYVVGLKRLEEDQCCRLMQQMCSAVALLHDHDICHRDLKPENFMLARKVTDKYDPPELKLIDFGLAQTHVTQDLVMKKLVGTPYYIAPGVLEGKYSIKCDVWSLGVIMYIMLYGNAPF